MREYKKGEILMRKIFSMVLVIMLVVSGFSGINIFAQENLNGQFMGATLNLGTTLTIMKQSYRCGGGAFA